MFPDRSSDPTETARVAAIDAVASVVARHLRHEVDQPKLRDEPGEPLILHVDGPGKSTFLRRIGRQLCQGDERPRWTEIRFDAWQHQRMAPPWWWLIGAFDRQLRQEFRRRGWWVAQRQRLTRFAPYRLRRLGPDIALGVTLVGLLIAAWWLSDMTTAAKTLGTIAGIVGAIAGLGTFGFALVNSTRRRVLSRAPLGASSLLRTTDPMEELIRRYEFLLHTAGANVLFLIDNLDRCRAEYVVEMLEGIQTMFRGQSADKQPLVAFVIAADEAWLCASYVKVYEEFGDSSHKPGRPFGLAFLDKIFDVSLKLPSVPASAVGEGGLQGRFADCETEIAVRRRLVEIERPGRMQLDLRIDAVKRLGELELNEERLCRDTREQLRDLRVIADLGSIVDKRLDTAYCVQRTTQLLGGHAIDDDENAIKLLGLWTMLNLRWPLLGDHLSRRPDDVIVLAAGQSPAGVDTAIAETFGLPTARRLAQGVDEVVLTAAAIRQFTSREASEMVPAGGNGSVAVSQSVP